MLKNVPLKEIMVSPAITAHVDDNFSKVEVKLRQKGIRHLPVVDDDRRVVGLITQRDLYRIISPRITEEGSYFDPAMLNGFILKYVMTKDLFTLTQEDTLSEAVQKMAQNKYGCIPVVDAEKKIVGIITEMDVLKFVARSLSQGEA